MILGLLVGGLVVFVTINFSWFFEGLSIDYIKKLAIYLKGLKPDQVVKWVFSLLGISIGLLTINLAFTAWITVQHRSIDRQDEDIYELHTQISELMKTKAVKK